MTDDPLERAIHDWLDPDRFRAEESVPTNDASNLDDDDSRRLRALLGESSTGSSPSRPKPHGVALEQVGPYRILGPIGTGGVGHVHRAEDLRDGSIVALKLLREEWLAAPRERERFRREAEAARRVDHPHCAKLLDAGEEDGIPYLAFERIDGEPLDERLRVERGAGRVSSFPAMLTLGAQIASALEALHREGIVHRDVKPSNIVLARDGRAVLVDFGLAAGKDLDSLTRTGEFAGSLPYAAPEQIQRGVRDVDGRADVYSLAATLYECATGLPLFRGASVEQLILAIAHAEPVPPSRIVADLPKAFDVVLLHALEKDPARRYPSAGDFARDLAAIDRGEPIAAKPPSWTRRARAWTKRHPFAAATIGALVVVCGIVPGALYVQEAAANRRLRSEERKTTEQRLRAEENLRRSIEAIDDVVSRAADPTLRAQAGTEAIRRAMLEDARRCFDALIANNVETAVMAIESSRALRQLGSLCTDLGDLDAAESAYRPALERVERWLERLRETAELHQDVADARHGLATIHLLRGDLGEAAAMMDSALVAYRRALELDPTAVLSRRGIASLLDQKATGHESRGELEEAEAAWREALEIQGGVVEQDGSAMQRRGMSHVLNNLASFLQRRNRLEEAIDLFRRALEEQNTILAEARNPEVERERLSALSNLGYAYTKLQRRDQSITLYREVIETAERFLATIPNDDVMDRVRGIAYFRLAVDLGREGDDSGCEAHYAKAIEIQEAHAKRQHQLPRHAVDCAITLGSFGARKKNAGRIDEARADLVRAKEWIDGAVAASPENASWTKLQREIGDQLASLPATDTGN